jgi:leucyl-tRNA synthetase
MRVSLYLDGDKAKALDLNESQVSELKRLLDNFERQPKQDMSMEEDRKHREHVAKDLNQLERGNLPETVLPQDRKALISME